MKPRSSMSKAVAKRQGLSFLFTSIQKGPPRDLVYRGHRPIISEEFFFLATSSLMTVRPCGSAFFRASTGWQPDCDTSRGRDSAWLVIPLVPARKWHIYRPSRVKVTPLVSTGRSAGWFGSGNSRSSGRPTAAEGKGILFRKDSWHRDECYAKDLVRWCIFGEVVMVESIT